jgi:lactoylglutathione lyase
MSNPLEFTRLSPNIGVKSVNESVDFYTNILGFRKIVSVPETGVLDWAMLQRESVTVMFQEEKNLVNEYKELAGKPVGGFLTFYITLKGFNSFYESVKDKVTVSKQPHQTFYGAMEFAIIDPNGYTITFAEDRQ